MPDLMPVGEAVKILKLTKATILRRLCGTHTLIHYRARDAEGNPVPGSRVFLDRQEVDALRKRWDEAATRERDGAINALIEGDFEKRARTSTPAVAAALRRAAKKVSGKPKTAAL